MLTPPEATVAQATRFPSTEKPTADTAVERGRAIYNFRCYVCHGYSGTGKTQAAQYLSPKPRNFTAPPKISAGSIAETLRLGRPGTGMKSFANILTERERADVAAFIRSEFMGKTVSQAAYHTTENGWPDHQAKYGLAYPFVTGELSLDAPASGLNAAQKSGRHLYQNACVTCHDPGQHSEQGAPWRTYPLSHQGCGVVCHEDGSVDFPWKKGHQPGTGSSLPVPGENSARQATGIASRTTPYDAHNIPPTITGLTATEKRGAVLFAKNCAFCHAHDGTGKNWIGAFLEPHARNFTDVKTTAHLRRDGALENAIGAGIANSSMPAWKSVLEPAEISDIAQYIRRAFFRPADEQAFQGDNNSSD